MAQHKLRSRIAQFKQPFLVGAVTSAALLSGCGGETQGTGANPDGLSGTSNECPERMPELGDACNEYESGLDCGYGDESSCSREFKCNDGAWEDVSPSCNPPPTELINACPVKAPATGQACNEYEPGLDCGYDDESSCPREFTCSDGAWEDVSPTCNPPPPELIDECPVKAPATGQACNEYEPGLDCGYDDESSCPREFTCHDGAWEDVSPTCNPPPPEPSAECPTDLPIPGDSCYGYQAGLTCDHLVPCDGGVGAVCGADGVWAAVITSCNPPPVVETDSGIDSTEPDAG